MTDHNIDNDGKKSIPEIPSKRRNEARSSFSLPRTDCANFIMVLDNAKDYLILLALFVTYLYGFWKKANQYNELSRILVCAR